MSKKWLLTAVLLVVLLLSLAISFGYWRPTTAAPDERPWLEHLRPTTIVAPVYERFVVMRPVPQGWLREMLQTRIDAWGGWPGIILVAIYLLIFPIWFFWVFDPWVESHVRKALARVWR